MIFHIRLYFNCGKNLFTALPHNLKNNAPIISFLPGQTIEYENRYLLEGQIIESEK